MKNILITQRVESVSHYNEYRDCLDQQWAKIMAKADLLPLPIINTLDKKQVDSLFERITIEGIILTGGNDIGGCENAVNVSLDRDNMEDALIEIASRRNIPILGICRGAQKLALYYGAKLYPIHEHVAVKHKITFLEKINFYEKTDIVNSYHGFGIANTYLPEKLTTLAIADDQSIEMFCIKKLPQIGIMWHPERENPFSKDDVYFIKNFFDGELICK